MDLDDAELLERFAINGSGDAFARLAERYSGMVYSAARRQLGDAHLAEDVAQAVFILLARKAQGLRGETLASWLLQVTFFACRDARKMVARRKLHEHRAAKIRAEQIRQESKEPPWEDYAGQIDAALANLRPNDRQAVALRFLRGMKLSEVGQAMGIGEDAARKQVDRAIIRLRKAIAGKVAAPEVAVLSSELVARGSDAAPTHLLQSITAISTSATKDTAQWAIAQKAGTAMTWLKIKVALGSLIVVAAVAAVTTTIIVMADGGAAPSSAPVVAAAPQAMPKEEPQPVDLNTTPMSPEDRAAMQLLDRRLPETNFTRVDISDAIDFLRDITNANIYVDWNALRAFKVTRTTPVFERSRDRKLSDVLNDLLASVGGGPQYQVRDGVIVISSANNLAQGKSGIGPDMRRIKNTDDPSLSDADRAAEKKLEAIHPSYMPPRPAFSDRIDFMRDLTKLDIVVDWPSLQRSGIDRTTIVGGCVFTNVKVSTALDYLLDQVGDGKLGYRIDHGAVVISTIDDLKAAVAVPTTTSVP